MRVVAAADTHVSTGSLRDLVALTKPRITATVLLTTAGGLGLAPVELPWHQKLLTIVGTGLVVSGASALNCWVERDIDGKMNRTRRRPLPAGRLSAQSALIFGLVLAALSIPLLTFGVHPLPGLLAFIAFVSYVWVYTPMKRMNSDALLVGAVPGAMPPLIGWTAATGRLDLAGLCLFMLLFTWQLPHFLAIAIYSKDDYARGGLMVHPVIRGEDSAKRWALVWAVAQLAVSLLLIPLGVAGWLYGVVAGIAGLVYVVYAAMGVGREVSRQWARRLMFGSIYYLCALFVALLVESW